MAKSLSGPKRIALLRQSTNPDIIAFIAKVDAATTRREVNRLNNETTDIPNVRNMEEIGGETVLWTLFDLCRAKESEINRAEKQAARDAIAQKKNEQDAKKESIQKIYKRYVDMPVLKAVLDQVSGVFHKQLKDWTISRYTPMVQKYFTDGMFNLERPTRETSNGNRDYYAKMEVYNTKIASVARFMLTPINEGKLSPRWEQILDKYAHTMADDIVNEFRFKLAMKLGAVIDAKGGAEIVVKGYVDHHTIDMKFPDGSSFRIKTQQVLAVSCKGKLFARYPTTFHNVRFEDGTKLAKPSAGRMRDAFGIDAKLEVEAKD